jgi:hypothetical protein
MERWYALSNNCPQGYNVKTVTTMRKCYMRTSEFRECLHELCDLSECQLIEFSLVESEIASMKSSVETGRSCSAARRQTVASHRYVSFVCPGFMVRSPRHVVLNWNRSKEIMIFADPFGSLICGEYSRALRLFTTPIVVTYHLIREECSELTLRHTIHENVVGTENAREGACGTFPSLTEFVKIRKVDPLGIR